MSPEFPQFGLIWFPVNYSTAPLDLWGSFCHWKNSFKVKLCRMRWLWRGSFSSSDEHVTKRDNEEFLEGYDNVLCINNVKRYVYWCLFIPFWFKNTFKTMKVYFVMQTKTKYIQIFCMTWYFKINWNIYIYIYCIQG